MTERRDEVVRALLSQHLPDPIQLGTGFVVLPDGNASHEIDILAWDPTIAAPL